MIVIPFSSDIIIGLALVLLGGSFILKAVFNIDIPILKMLIGILLILWGLSFFVDIKFTDKKFKNRHGKNYTSSIDVDSDDTTDQS